MNKTPKGSDRSGKSLVRFSLILFVLILGIGIGSVISYRADATGPGDSQLQIQEDGKPLVGDAVLALSQAFDQAAKMVEPAVVNINTEEVVRMPQLGIAPGQVPDGQMDDFFRRFFGDVPQMPEQYTRRSLGSGILVDPKGYIITNNHVVEGATKIKVSVPEGEEYTAKVIAGDSLSDIAVIKIDGSRDFPFVKIGNAKAMKTGDWVIAIGSPFGLEQTVTAGIISATSRFFDTFNDYLQTDAAINPGNSGGPLVNMNGEVVGINSFIKTEAAAANAGVGFAVPSHIFVKVYNQILEKGKVSRGWVGVSMNPLPFTPAMAEFFGVEQGSGVLIVGLIDEKGKSSNSGPAAKAGILPEDVIVEYDGNKVFSNQDFRLAVANTPPSKKVNVRVIRHGEEKEFEVALAERTIEDEERGSYSFDSKPEEPKLEMGLTFDDVPSRLAEALDIPGGALIISVKPGSLAEEAGLQAQGSRTSDIIVSANGEKVESAQDLLAIVKNMNSGEAAVLKVIRAANFGQAGVSLDSSIAYTSIIKP